MHISLTMNVDNAAFKGENMVPEIVRILRKLADDIDTNGVRGMKLRDVNGNTSGSGRLTAKPVLS